MASLYGSDSESLGRFSRLVKSLTGVMSQEGLSIPGRQASPISTQALDRLYGVDGSDFMQSYRNFEDKFFRAIADKKNLRRFANVSDLELEKKSGVINLSLLNSNLQRQFKEEYKKSVLRLPELLGEVGLPGMEYPSGNIYSKHLLKFDVAGTALDSNNPVASFLNRMFFNVDSSKTGYDAFNFGQSSILSSSSLERIQATKDINTAGKRVLTFDVETTGVFNESQVRQFAYEVTDARGKVVNTGISNFINEQMDIASVSKSGMSTRMSQFVAEAESGGRNVSMMGEGGENFVSAAKTLMTEMNNADHISGHNVLFDLNKIKTTLESLQAFQNDTQAQTQLRSLFERIYNQKDYLIDTAETMRSFFTKRAEEIVGGSPDRAARIVSQTLGPETLASIGIGGSTAPISVENIALNTNLLKLIEAEGTGPDTIAGKLISNKQSHMADIDVALQGAMDRYRQSGQLDFRFDVDPNSATFGLSIERDKTTGAILDSPLTDFEKFARSKILKSQAMVPTRDIANVEHAGQATRYFLTSDAGIREATVIANASMFGVGSNNVEGFLKFNKGSNQFQFTQFGSMESINVDKATAEGYIRNTFQEAFAEGEGRTTSLIAGKTITRNLHNERIIKTGINFIQESKIQRISTTKSAFSALGISTNEELAGAETVMKSLGLTSAQFAETKSISSMFQRLGRAFRGLDPENRLRPATSLTDEVMQQYMVNAAKVGLPFTSLDVSERVMSVGLSQVTSHIGEAAGMNLTHARNAKLTSEMGLSYAKMGNAARLGSISSDGTYEAPSKIIAPFQSIFDYEETRKVIGGVEQVSSQGLRVKAFAQSNLATVAAGGGEMLNENIIASDLNRLTLSFVEERTLGNKVIPAKANIVFGANKSLSESESRSLAEYLLNGAEDIESTLRSVGGQDNEVMSSLNNIVNIKNQFSSSSEEVRSKVTSQVAEHIRERGIVIGDLGEGNVDLIQRLLKTQGVDLINNDVRLVDLGLRIAHADKDSGVITLSAMSDELVDRVQGRTAATAQQETLNALNKLLKVEGMLDESENKRIASRTVMEAQNASRTETAIAAGSRKLQNVFDTPMTDFYLKNKRKIGFATLGLAAVGTGYYMAKKHREADLYNETLKPQSFEPGMPRQTRPPSGAVKLNSTRRDPLVTAGVVGGLDRNKIGHTQMGPNKYNHLYGG